MVCPIFYLIVISFLKYLCLFICLSTLGLSFSLWGLDPQLDPGPFLVFGSWSLSHWTTSRVSHHYFLSVWQQKTWGYWPRESRHQEWRPDYRRLLEVSGGIHLFHIGRFWIILIRAESVVDHLQKWQQFFSFYIHVPPFFPLRCEVHFPSAYIWTGLVTCLSVGYFWTRLHEDLYISTQSLESLPSHENKAKLACWVIRNCKEQGESR